jgi:predicted SprT family Zn-dependent metalloprotease
LDHRVVFITKIWNHRHHHRHHHHGARWEDLSMQSALVLTATAAVASSLQGRSLNAICNCGNNSITITIIIINHQFSKTKLA